MFQARNRLYEVICLGYIISRGASLDPCLNLPVLAGPTMIELPLCGNGVLDQGEICDDGNRVGGDGCNAWCSGFDKMTRACTLAGQNPFYASGDQRQCIGATAVLKFGPAQAFFCNLNAIAASPDGKFVVVAEGGLLVQMELFTDAFSASLSIVPATLIQPLVRVCALFVLQQQAGIIAHECEEQSIRLFVNGGTQASTPFSMPLLKPAQKMRSYMDGDVLVLAGVATTAGIAEASTCIHVYSFNTTAGKGSLVVSIECVVYNVLEKGLIYPSFSIAGMVPYQVTKDPCPFQMQAAECYVVHMERADMQVLKAYIAVDGGLDLHYTVSTDDKVNVLGAPLNKQGQGNENRYTLTGNCFTLQGVSANQVKRAPPMVALGNACGPMPLQPNSAACSTPLNNPFITEVATSSYLLPEGLSSAMQHQTLLSIFNDTHLPLYRLILDNTHNGTVPIDFVELPGTMDIVYITETTIGLVSTKGIMHLDIFNPGYCRATQAIACPTGFFGSVVGGVCLPCTEQDSSVSAQIQCAGVQLQDTRRRRLMSAGTFQSAPYVHVGLIVSNEVTQSLLDWLASYYLVMKGHNCTAAATGMMTAHEPYNMRADYAQAQIPPPTSQLVTQLIAEATARDAIDYAGQISEEYLIGWTTQQTALIEALSSYAIPAAEEAAQILKQTCGVPSELISALQVSECRFKLNKDFHRQWLPCALPIAISATRNASSRRALQQATTTTPSPASVEHSQCTFMSSTTVTYAPANGLTNDKQPAPLSGTRGTATSSTSNGGNGSMWIILGGVAGGLVVSGLLVLVIYLYCIARPLGGQSQGEYKIA